jgi:TonB-linked SusC/RagA family outer membrane protein
LLQSPQPGGTLVFSYVGYTDQLADFSSGNLQLTVKMHLQRKLEEVVIVGYGVQKKSDVTGAISSIKGKDIANQPIANLAGSLEGKLSGIHVVTPSGTPGAGLLVSVRGSENPLYVVDGIPMISESNSSLATSYDTQGNITGNGQNVSSISDINPDDIASIEVLKDASSASIYGARAANGVVLITTKRGIAGKTSFNLNYYSGIQQVSKNIQFLSADGFRNLVLDAQHQDLLKYQQDPSYFGDGFDPGILTTPLPSGWFSNVNTNWLGQIFQVAPVNNAELSASGGTDKSRFYISSSYFDQEGIVVNSYYKRFSNRINLDQTVNDRLSFGENLSLSYSRNRRSFNDDTYTGIVTNALGASPFEPVHNPDGTYSDYTLYQSLWLSDNPVKSANEVIAFTNNYRVLGTIYANYKILPELAFRTSWSVDYTYLTDDQYWSPITSDAVTVGGKADNNSFNQIVWLGENTLTYDKTFNNKSPSRCCRRFHIATGSIK